MPRPDESEGPGRKPLPSRVPHTVQITGLPSTKEQPDDDERRPDLRVRQKEIEANKIKEASKAYRKEAIKKRCTGPSKKTVDGIHVLRQGEREEYAS